MSNLLPLHALGLSFKPRLGTAEVEAMIDYLPEAALLIDLKQRVVVLGNSKATELTTYTRAELAGLPLNLLFTPPDDSDDNLQNILKNNEQDRRLDLLKRGGNRIASIARVVNINPAKNFYLMTVETVAAFEQRQQALERQEQLWVIMQTLASAPFQLEIEAALATILEACRNLTGSAFLCIYQARGDLPLYVQKTRLGDQDTFPDQLSPSDIATLNSISIWMTGKRPTCSLHRMARSANFSYMASIPIGDASASIGLLLVAGYSLLDTHYLEAILRAMTTYINSVLQGYTLINQMQHDIQLQQKHLSITSAVQGAVDEGVIILSPELAIASINRSAENCLGYSNAEVINQSIYNILIGSEELTSAFISTQRGRNYSTQDTVKLFRRNGNPFPARLRLWPIFMGDTLQNILVIFQDLSEQEEYRTRNQQLEQRALLGEVTASFAHEVRNPINNISTGLQLLAYNLPADDPNQDNIHRLQNDCERLAELVKSSLSFVRPMEYMLEPINLDLFLSHTLERWKPRLERCNIKPHLQVEENLPLIEGDIRALEQVLTNLISNAIQAMDGKEGMLALKARRVLEPAIPSQVEISISDTGPGIPQEIRDRIFEPFFTTKQSGTGLGLAIVKRIITAHKGAIHVNSMPGGTIFSVILPAIRDSGIINGDT